MRLLLALCLAFALAAPAFAEPSVIDKVETKLGKPLDHNQKSGVIEYSRRAKSSLLNAQRQYVDRAAHDLAAPPTVIREAATQTGAPIDGATIAAALEKEWKRKLTGEERQKLAAVDAEHKELTGRILAAYRSDLARTTGLPESAFEGLLP